MKGNGMPITSENVLRKMNEIQHKGGPSIGHWHQLRRWLKEDGQVQESFQDAVRNDPDMTAEQKAYWLSQTQQSLSDGMEYHMSHDDRYNITSYVESFLEEKRIGVEVWNVICALDHLGYLKTDANEKGKV